MATEHDTDFNLDGTLRTRASLENPRADDFHEKFNEDSDLPGVNRKKTTSKLITSVGYLTLLVLALIAVWIVNKPSTTAKEKPSDAKVSNRLPAFEVPALTEPPPAPVAKLTGAKVESMDLDFMRRLKGNVVEGGTGSNAAKGRPNEGEPMTAADRIARAVGEARARFSEPNQSGALAAGAGNNPALDGAAGIAALGGDGGGQSSVSRTNGSGGLGANLQATKLTLSSATVLPNRNFVIAKGTPLDCVLETAISTAVPNMATCRLTRDIYSDNGQVVLLDRGSQLVGEYQGDLRAGQARMFMLWTRAKTPNGVVVTLDSPGIDPLGRGGITGHIDNHFWDRFGAAIMTSLLSDSIKIILDNNTQNQAQNLIGITQFGNTVNGGSEVVKSILEQQSKIPPTLTVNQGVRLNVMLARDLDFSEVYNLKAVDP